LSGNRSDSRAFLRRTRQAAVRSDTNTITTMITRRSGVKRLLFVASAAALLVVGCAEEFGKPDGEVPGYERVVLAELFTATWCGNCPKAEAALDQLYEEEGPDKIAVIHWHPTQQGDPFGLTVTDERWSAYKAQLDTLNAASFPTCIFGGSDMVIGAATIPYDEYRNSYEHERELGSHLDLSLALDIGEEDVTVDVGIESDAEATPEELELWVVTVEHRIPRPDIPGSEELFSFVARAVDVQVVETEVSVQQHKEVTIPIDESWDRDKLHIVAFLQPEGLGPVRQAAMASLSFRAFSLTAADTTFTGEVAPRSFTMPFTIENTGTQRDSLEINLPAAMLDLPQDWTAVLQGTVAHPSPMTLVLGPGEVADSLSVRVTTAGSSGKGEVGLTARSLVEADLDQKLTFHFQYGGFSFTAAGPEQPVAVEPGQTAFGPLTLHNTGIEDLQIVVELPASQPNLPSGWTATIATSEGAPLASPDTIDVAASTETDDVGVKVTTNGAGIGSVRVLVSSPQTISAPQEITIDVRAGEVAFTVAPAETTVVMQIGILASVPCRVAQTGSITSPIFVDARSAGLPEGWVAVVCSESQCYGNTHLFELDELDNGIIVELQATSAGSGTAPILFSSPIVPAVVDTLLIHYSIGSGAAGFDRVVVAELFTSIICPNCPKAEGGLDSLFAEEGEDRMALVYWHPATGVWGRPNFGTPEADARMTSYFGSTGVSLPRVVFDGGETIVGAGAPPAPYNTYRPRFDAHIAEPSPALIHISHLVGTAEVTVNASIEASADSALADLELTVVLMEYAKEGIVTGYPGPIPPPAISGAGRTARTVDVTSVPAGTTVPVDPIVMSVDATWPLDRLYIVAILQDPSTLEAIQGAMVRLNPGPPPKQ
jgi:hypothetical protein